MVHEVQRPPTRVGRVVTAGSLDQAIDVLRRGGAKPVAGGTDLLVELDRALHPEIHTLVDLSRIPGLDTIEVTDGVVTIGPLVTHNRCVADERLHRAARPLVQACWEVGSPQLRNRATVAGNIVTASPANDTLSALVALDAEVTLTSATGRRRLPIGEFVLGVRRTALAGDELLTGISFPALDHRWRSAYVKLGLRQAQAISVVHLAVACRLADRSGDVEEVRLALGSVAPTIVRAAEAEAVLIGGPLADDRIAAAAEAAAGGVEPIDDLRATAEYRSRMVAETVVRALRAVRDDASEVPVDPPLLWGGSGGRWPTGEAFAADHGGPDSVIESTVNGASVEAPGVGLNLLDWLRSTGATGTKEGCAEGECGSCTVHLDGAAVLSCLVPATRANRAEVTTIEGLDHPLQEAFVAAGAVQCGFCIPGFLMSGAMLLDGHPAPADAQIKAGLSGNLCRCTGYYKIEDAVRVALGEATT